MTIAVAIAIAYLEVPKLTDGEVRGVDGLTSLSSADAHAYLRLLNHRNIIGAVSYGQRGDNVLQI